MPGQSKHRRGLLVVDLQTGFVKEGTKSVLSNVDRILRTHKFDFIIQTQWVNNNNSNYISKLFYKGCLPGTDEKLCLEVKGSKVLRRCCYSAWCNSMASLLRKDDEIYVVGLETDACVLATCFSLFDNGYTFKVVRDAVGTNRQDLQIPVLQLMYRNFGESCLLDTDNIMF